MRYRKKPVEVEAVRLTPQTIDAAEEFAGAASRVDLQRGGLVIATLEGSMHASWGDYIIRGVRGELYPCKPDIFDETYEPVPEAGQ